MTVKFILSIAVCFLLSYNDVAALQAVNGRVKITIGTTAGCGDTVRFIANQLEEAYDVYKDFLDIEFIPWGRTVRNDDGSLRCQFQDADCWANRLHRCVLNMFNGNQEAQMHYMKCEFTSPFPSFVQGSYLCAHAMGLNLVDVDHCVANGHGTDALDLEAERRGTEITAGINFIPSIVFNDQIDVDLHAQSLNRLSSMICFALAEDPSTGVTNCTL